MHTTEIGASNVPAFLIKLWKLVEDEDTNDLICWRPNGQSFVIHNQTQFAKELLPLYFKHNNMASFIRQLNMYGFRKVASIDQGALKSDRDDIEFFHNFFIRGQECMLEFIKRKAPAGRAEDSRAKADVLKELLSDVGSMQGRQEHADQMLSDMKKENEALWREVAMLRQKHIKQQQIVEKLIQFLVTLVQGNRNITVKRKLPLMLQDSQSSSTKIPRLKKSQFGTTTDYQVSSPASLSDGPMIHDVTDIIEDVADPSILVTGNTSVRPESAAGSNVGASSSVSVASPLPLSPAPPGKVVMGTTGILDLDSAPIVASPLDPNEPIEPLSLMEALSDSPSGIYILPESTNEVEVSSGRSGSSANIDASTTGKSPCITSDGTQVSRTNPTVPPPSLGDRIEAVTPSNDLLSSCVMLENIPLIVGQADPDTGTPQGCSQTHQDTKDPAATTSTSSTAVPHVQDTGMQVALQDKSSTANARVFSEHVEGIDTELDWLQDQLMSGGLNLDSSTLMGLFSSDDPLASCLGDLIAEGRDTDAVGNEVVQYTPSLLDLEEIDDDPVIFNPPTAATTKSDLTSSGKSVSPIQTPIVEQVGSPINLSMGKKGASKKRRGRK
ncbi:heat shock factor protein-like isoform X2 [Ornithodoros turicata]|uniref:heat shock factor protein-like isoform X2 n=1 Tax=Ornithodoros turicata TaxID=34597 RepID=UPI00313A39FA